MGFDVDFTELKKLLESEIFKPATPDIIKQRAEDRKKELASKKIIPVDQKADSLDQKYWKAYSDLLNRLDIVRADHNVGECECSWESLEAAGEEITSTDLPGDNGYVERRCLRCGGTMDAG